ncbi:hypothetical protein JIQ42_02612 [Leishmania sp. Namibia]|uniref:hypothetical protein n=1 Tax=Leishmania sp. Namibia TaxID=2802991 RepID=UPI001B40C0D8|nr:hypothetical protein JIQ42_02612 [Leishmania sp. Namibia]
MPNKETSASYELLSQPLGTQAEENSLYLCAELDASADEGHKGENNGKEAISSTEALDPYDFSRYDPQHQIELQDKIRADRVARRLVPTNVFQKYFDYLVPYGGLMSTGLNLASSSIGAGIIALPYAFNSSGLIMAIIYMVIIAYLTIYSYYLLGQAGTRTGLRNYEQIVRTLLGPGADYFLAFCMWFLSFGGEVSYVISVKDVLTAFLEDADSTPGFLLNIWGQRLLTFIVWLVAMLPPCLPKEINTLRYFSCIAIVFIVYFVIAMVVHSAQNGLRADPRPEIRMFTTGNTAISGLATFMFAFLSQLNAYESYEEMKNPTPLRLTLGASISVGIVFVLYFFAGLFGYLDFGDVVTGSALKHYTPVKDMMMGVGYAGILFKLCVGFGLHMIPDSRRHLSLRRRGRAHDCVVEERVRVRLHGFSGAGGWAVHPEHQSRLRPGRRPLWRLHRLHLPVLHGHVRRRLVAVVGWVVPLPLHILPAYRRCHWRRVGDSLLYLWSFLVSAIQLALALGEWCLAGPEPCEGGGVVLLWSRVSMGWCLCALCFLTA